MDILPVQVTLIEGFSVFNVENSFEVAETSQADRVVNCSPTTASQADRVVRTVL